MRSPLRSCLIASCIALAAPLAFAQNTIDQKQEDISYAMGGFFQSGLAQSFQTSADSISGAGIELWPRAEEDGPVTIALWDALPTQGGVKLAEGVAKGVGTLWADTFWKPVKAEANKTYFLTFTSDVPIFIIGGSLDNYKKGMAYANDYTPFSQYDYTFRTYAAPLPAQTTPVPEPATAAMMLAGLGLLAGQLRRKTRQRPSR